MSSAELLVAHGAILAAAMAGHFKHLNTSDYYKKYHEGLKDLQEALKNQLAEHLKAWLSPIVRGSPASSSGLVDASGAFYETFADPLGGEGYRNAISVFLEDNLEQIIDCKTLRGAVDNWEFWTNLQSKVYTVGFILEGFVCVFLFVVGKVLLLQVDMPTLVATSIPALLCFTVLGTSATRISAMHSIFLRLTKKYDVP